MQKFKLPIFFAIILFILLLISIVLKNKATSTFQDTQGSVTITETSNMKLTSSVIKNGKPIPAVYTCDGANVNPSLNISDPPNGTKSFAIIVDDVDAPSGDFIHWAVWNINPSTTSIAENSTPKGAVVGLNDFGKVSYGGPCPPSGTHHYYFRLYALDSMLDLKKGADKNDLNNQILDHVLDHDDLMGTYTKK